MRILICATRQTPCRKRVYPKWRWKISDSICITLYFIRMYACLFNTSCFPRRRTTEVKLTGHNLPLGGFGWLSSATFVYKRSGVLHDSRHAARAMTSRAPTHAVIWWMAAAGALTKCALVGQYAVNERPSSSLLCIYAGRRSAWPDHQRRYPVVGWPRRLLPYTTIEGWIFITDRTEQHAANTQLLTRDVPPDWWQPKITKIGLGRCNYPSSFYVL